jgi:microcystin degradation protein MlrC
VAFVAGFAAAEVDRRGGTNMSGYYAYFVGDHDHITNRVIIIAANDKEAKERAKQLVDRQVIELWQEGRRIATFHADE